jgi:hypothetical protein
MYQENTEISGKVGGEKVESKRGQQEKGPKGRDHGSWVSSEAKNKIKIEKREARSENVDK